MCKLPERITLKGIGGDFEELSVSFDTGFYAVFFAEDSFESARVTLPHNEVRQLHDALGKYIKDHLDKID